MKRNRIFLALIVSSFTQCIYTQHFDITLTNFAYSLLQLSEVLPKATALVPIFTQNDIVAQAKFDGIPVTQLRVFDQAAEGGDASCGYQALKNIAITLQGIATQKPFTAELQSTVIPHKLFVRPKETADGGFNPEPGPWRAFIIYEKNVPSFFSPIIQDVFDKSVIFKPLNAIVDDFAFGKELLLNFYYETFKKFLGKQPVPAIRAQYFEYLNAPDTATKKNRSIWNYTLDTNIIKPVLENADTYWRDAQGALERRFGDADFEIPEILAAECCTQERIAHYLNPTLDIKISLDFTKPVKLARLAADARDRKLTRAFEEAYNNLDQDTQKILNDYIALRGGSLRNAFNTKLEDFYNAIELEIAQPLDVLGDWINEKNILDLIPLARKDFPAIPNDYQILAIENITNITQQKTFTSALAALKEKNAGALGIILGGQSQDQISSRHWLAVVIVKTGPQYQILVLDSLANTNRLQPGDDVASGIFNKRIQLIVQKIAQG